MLGIIPQNGRSDDVSWPVSGPLRTYYDLRVHDRALAAEELQTARLSLRRPADVDVESIFAIHNDPETCLHNPSDALARFEEAEALYQCWDEQWRRCGYGYWVVR